MWNASCSTQTGARSAGRRTKAPAHRRPRNREEHMRRVVLALAMTVGLAIGTMAPASALDTSVTLNCSDGTSVKLVVDADTLTGLTQAVQAMINYPAGLSCSLIQNPLGVTFGQIAFAGAGQNPFIVGGGRWQATVTCADLGITPPPPPPPPP